MTVPVSWVLGCRQTKCNHNFCFICNDVVIHEDTLVIILCKDASYYVELRLALCIKTVYHTHVFAWVQHGSTAWECHRLSRWERHNLMCGELELPSVYLPYMPIAWTNHVVVMHTHINYKGTCVIEVEQKCYSVISREQEAKYVERHKSNGDTLIFPFSAVHETINIGCGKHETKD